MRWIPLGQRATGDQRLHLATLTLMNPDVQVETVLSLLPEVMRFAEHLTTYNDTNDGALFYSLWFQKLVPGWYQGRPRATRSMIFGRTLKSVWVERSGISSDCQLRGDLLEEVLQPQLEPCSRLDSGLHFPSGPDVPGQGSIDIINCSGIDQNVHKLRHNYYMLNTQMVEDVCELIGERLTAPYRQRLCQVDANIFIFLSPPAHVKK